MDYYNAQRNAVRGSRPAFTEQDMKVLLRNRLNDGQLPNMPPGFPFHHVLDPRGAAHISYDPFEFQADFDVPGGQRRARISLQNTNNRHCWLVYLPPSARSVATVAVAHVRVDPQVMATKYGKYLERDSRVILGVLSRSIELGLLITITISEAQVVFVATANNGRKSIVYNAGPAQAR
ncbi:hypothetical protein DFH06DRAFT_1344803 [Mycena polygramma]|nr:hypothetical protein DFH06DRAFT_1344803 [Mycena polygramma]